jgi:hypothetical protein
MTTDTIKAIQKQIVAKLEAGEDVSQLTRQLAEERAKIAAQAEVEELKKIANERQKLRDEAAKVQERVKLQGENIDKFLKLRDTLVSQLQPLIEPMKELAKMQSMNKDGPGECYAGFFDIGQFSAEVNKIPAGYLPADFGCPFLEMADGKQDARDKAGEACAYLAWAYGILVNFQKGISTLPLRSVDGLMALDNEPEIEGGSCIVCEHPERETIGAAETSGTEPKPVETETLESEPVETVGSETICKVCTHPERETIDNLLRQGKPLRDLESEFGVSRSTLSRHKNRCLNLGAIRIHE